MHTLFVRILWLLVQAFVCDCIPKSATAEAEIAGPALEATTSSTLSDKALAVKPWLPEGLRKYIPLNGTMGKSLQGTDGGGWSVCTHLGTYGLNFDIGLGRLLTKVIKPESSLEFGAGIGIYVDYLTRYGNVSCAIGIEPKSMRITGLMSGDGIKKGVGAGVQLAMDLTVISSETEELFGQFDVVYSIEVFEHIPKEFHTKLFDFLARRAKKWVVFAASDISKTGVGHIASRPLEEWKNEWLQRGFVYMSNITTACQTWLLDVKNIYHRRDIMVFTRPPTSGGGSSTSIAGGSSIIIDELVRTPDLVDNKAAESGATLWPLHQKQANRCRTEKKRSTQAEAQQKRSIARASTASIYSTSSTSMSSLSRSRGRIADVTLSMGNH